MEILLTMSPTPSPASRSARAARNARAALSRASRRAVMAAAVALGATFLMGAGTSAAAAVGQQAPDFIAVDTSGRQHQLSDFAGQVVVLEWTNPASPLVQKHYDSGVLPAAQQDAIAKGAVWLAIHSTGRDAGDYLPPAALDAWMKQKHAAATAVLMDQDGVIGQAYGTQAGAQLFIIDAQGVLVYAGGIDSTEPLRGSHGANDAVAADDVSRALEKALHDGQVSPAEASAAAARRLS